MAGAEPVPVLVRAALVLAVHFAFGQGHGAEEHGSHDSNHRPHLGLGHSDHFHSVAEGIPEG